MTTPFYTRDSLKLIEHTTQTFTSFLDFAQVVEAWKKDCGAVNESTHVSGVVRVVKPGLLGDIILNTAAWNLLVKDPQFACFFDPVCKTGMLERGWIGILIGHNIFTDAFMPEPSGVFDESETEPKVVLVKQVHPDAKL